jgi:hypothetical protein
MSDKVDWVKINEKANKLYELVKTENRASIPNPESWLYDQGRLRKMWEKYKNSIVCLNVAKDVVDILMTNSFYIYMEFMYDSYPDYDYQLGLCYDGLNRFTCHLFY